MLFGEPIVATSCNMAGEPAITDLKLLTEEFKSKIDLIVDEGKSEIGVPSTIIKLEGSKIEILRKGPISKEELKKALK